MVFFDKKDGSIIGLEYDNDRRTTVSHRQKSKCTCCSKEPIMDTVIKEKVFRFNIFDIKNRFISLYKLIPYYDRK